MIMIIFVLHLKYLRLKKKSTTSQKLSQLKYKNQLSADSYCLILGQISGSKPIWSTLFCSQHELEHSIPAPGRLSRCSDHTSSAQFLYTSALPSSAPVVLCHPQRCPHSCTKEKETNLRRQVPQHCSVYPQAANLHFCLLAYCFV